MTFECYFCGREVEVEDKEVAARIVMLEATSETARLICGVCYKENSPDQFVRAAWMRAGHLGEEWEN